MKTLRLTFIVMMIATVVVSLAACSKNESQSMQGTATEQSPAESQEAPSTQAAQPVPQETPPVAQETQPVPPVGQTGDAQQPAEAADATEITGTVAQADGGGIVINTDSGEYLVLGQDLSEMIGKMVTVTGAVEESEGRHTINVTSVMEAQ